MRIGAAWWPCSNANYRVVDPVNAMAQRGHEIVVSPSGDGAIVPPLFETCDVVHVYRLCDEATRRTLTELVRRGTPVVYDNDDDFTAVPKQSPNYREVGGLEGFRGLARSAKIARLAHTFTTTNEALAEKYVRAGAERAEVLPNCVRSVADRPRVRHDGVVVGWIAGGEHKADAELLKIADALARLLAKHDSVRVECIGVNLGLPERYRHDPGVPFEDLPRRMGAFDVGIAPLADIPLNRVRSDIKLKEYAACGVPWLASPVGPYAGLGEAEGGRLVPDDAWFEALDALVTQSRDRKRLAQNAERWAAEHTIESVADRWEQVFAAAAGVPVEARPAVASGISLRIRSRRRPRRSERNA